MFELLSGTQVVELPAGLPDPFTISCRVAHWLTLHTNRAGVGFFTWGPIRCSVITSDACRIIADLPGGLPHEVGLDHPKPEMGRRLWAAEPGRGTTFADVAIINPLDFNHAISYPKLRRFAFAQVLALGPLDDEAAGICAAQTARTTTPDRLRTGWGDIPAEVLIAGAPA